MPYSYAIYTGNGATTQFTVPFPYIRREHVFASLDYVSAVFTWVNNTTVQISPAPANGVRVEVRRITPVNNPLVDFTDGSTLVAADLDTNYLQQTYINQEQDDQFNDGVYTNVQGLPDAGGKRITNVGNPTAAQDVATKSYTDNWFNTYGESYLGAYAADPATKPNGGALVTGNVYFNTATGRLRVYSGTSWTDGAAPTSLFRWKKTAAGGETSLSGNDDDTQPLAYTADYEQVYVNGVLLTRGVDYVAINGTTITDLAALTAGDVVEVMSFNAFTIGTVPTEVNFTAMPAANQPIDNSDLFLVRQGTTNKKVTASIFRTELATDAQAAQAAAEAAEAGAETAEAGALGAKAGAEAARDAAIIQAGLYVDEATGRAAVADGQAFKVQGTAEIAAFEYRRINSTTSQLIAIYPSAAYITDLRYELAFFGLEKYTGTGPVYPLVLDNKNRVVFAYDSTEDTLTGVGLVNNDNVKDAVEQGVLGPLSLGEYTGSGPVYPIVLDRNNRVLLGFDAASESLIGPGIGGSGGGSGGGTVVPGADAPLAEPVITKAINHLIFYGQSLAVGAAGGAVLSTTQPYSNVTFNGGPRAWTGSAFDFTAFKPLVEDNVAPAPDGGTNRSETPCSGAANYAITLAATEDGLQPSSHVILASTAGKGGSRIDQLEKGTSWYANTFLPHINGARNLNSDYAVHAFGWVQGENDSTGATQTPYATYRAKLNQLQIDIENDVKAVNGQTTPVYCLTYQTCANARTWKDQCLAQLDLAQKNSRFFLATPIYHLPHAGDAVHLTSAGYKWMGAYFGRAYKRLVIDGVQPRWLNPLSATVRGNVIRVRFDVPTAPLVLDVDTLAVTTDFGFKVLDGVATAPISSVAVDGSEVVITLGSVPAGGVTVRYGLDYLGAGLNITGGGSGNLRDSDPSTIAIGGVDRPLYNVCPHFELAAITLGE